MKIQLKQIVDEGCMRPKGYGLAYYGTMWQTAVYYPIPLNIIIRFCLNVYWSLARGVFKSQRDKQISIAQQAGYNEGYKDGCYRIKREIDEKLGNLGYLPFDEILQGLEEIRKLGYQAFRRNDE